MKALLLIDIQNDFLPGGALAVSEGDQVVPIANRLMELFPLVVATQDWHPGDHRSFASQHDGREVGEIIVLDGLEQVLWPDHCVQLSQGANLAKELNLNGVDHVIQKGTDVHIDSYSGFFDNDHRKSTGLEQLLRGHEVREVQLVGLATDYCVKFSALDAVALGFKTSVCLEGIRGVELNAGDCEKAIQEMQSAGVEIIQSELQ
ncbi:bifunctional nicotinamidase/pyrazinamidase [Blastopirellula marina]|uniref:Nicotinamidase n=1 Tax=Blastopirellula marina TaxID=124 RepID=A0A2S8F0S7_9BACT|nr:MULTISPECIES: bifunctional nicotinamidase/pyrazinamidase [Pirellulaceae]PQO25766.1 bifunctional nicotinamidase/pyrazinamidase [Blastopirellula marina]RCS43449.1 bifunctional nicotinamidase/pyrazinamidase [Bremerella cremea]